MSSPDLLKIKLSQLESQLDGTYAPVEHVPEAL